MGKGSQIGGLLGGLGGLIIGGPAGAAQGYGLGASIGGGMDDQGNADKYGQMAVDQAKREYDSRAPYRRMGMQVLGQSESPIDMGNLGYNSMNPFARARGKTASNATRFQSQPLITGPETNKALGIWDGVSAPESTGAPNLTAQSMAGLPQKLQDHLRSRMGGGA